MPIIITYVFTFIFIDIKWKNSSARKESIEMTLILSIGQCEKWKSEVDGGRGSNMPFMSSKTVSWNIYQIIEVKNPMVFLTWYWYDKIQREFVGWELWTISFWLDSYPLGG